LPTRIRLKEQVQKRPNTAKFDTAKKSAVVDSAVLKTAFGAATLGKEEFVTVENDELALKLSTKGGRIYSAELKKFKTAYKKPLVLLAAIKTPLGLNFSAQGKPINTNDLYFTPSATELKVAGQRFCIANHAFKLQPYPVYRLHIQLKRYRLPIGLNH
jgi:YidC/Oxa1 family membrane protein insertase